MLLLSNFKEKKIKTLNSQTYLLKFQD